MRKYEIFVTVILFCSITEADGQCNLPLTDGTWLTSSRGTWIIKSNGLVIENVETSLSATQPTTNLTCETQSGTKYIFSTTVAVFADVTVTSYTCVDIRTTSSSPQKYLFYFVTAKDQTHGDYFTTNLTAVCLNTDYETSSNTHIILKEDSVYNVTTGLPNVIRGVYTVNFTATDGANVTGSTMDSCSDVNIMAFNQSDNSKRLGFSASGVFLCVYTMTVGDLNYVITYNNDTTVDSSTTYIFACWVFSYSSSDVVATVYPRLCQSSQNSTTVPSDGQTLTFQASVTCSAVDSDDEDEGLDTVWIVVIVVLSCLLVVVVIVIIICILKYKSKTKKNENKQPLKTIEPDTFTTVDETGKSENDTLDQSTQTTFDRPWTRWSKSMHKKMFKSQKSVPESKTDSSVISGYADTDITIRKTYVSMAPTSVLFTSTRNKSHSKESLLNNGPGMLKRRSKTMVESRKRKHVIPYKERRNKVESSENTRKHLETLQMMRTKTFHDFSREFNKLKPFPIENEQARTAELTKANIDKTHPENAKQKEEHKEIDRPETRPSTQKSRPSTTGHLTTRLSKSESPAKRTRSEAAVLSNTVIGFSYNSPYALTPQQKRYFAERTLWVRQMKRRDNMEERELTEKRVHENNAAYKAWLKNKATKSQKLKQFYNSSRKRKIRNNSDYNNKEVTWHRPEHSNIESTETEASTHREITHKS